MNYPLTTTTILEYETTFIIIKNSNLFTRWKQEYLLAICTNDVMANALTSKLGITNGDMVGTFAWNHAPHV
jgi:fatty-acyl-CoA synthase